MNWLIRHRSPALLLIDIISFQLAFLATYAIRFESGMFVNPLRPQIIPTSWALVLFWLAIFVLRGMYQRQNSISRYEAMIEVIRSVMVGLIVLFIISFDPSHPVTISRFILITYGILLIIFTGGGRAAFRTIIRAMYRRRLGLFRSVIVGYGERGQTLHETLRTMPEFGHEVVAIVLANDDEVEAGDFRIENMQNLENLLDSEEFDGPVEFVLLTLEPANRDMVMNIIDRISRFPVRIMIMPDFFQILVGMAKTRELYGVPLLEVFPDLLDPFPKLIKRLLDILVSLFVLTLGLPLMLLIAIAIRIETKGPALFLQKRVGYRGREYTLLKFRTMIANAEEQTGAVWATKDDPRITKIGRALRNTRLDELPQAWNVLKGDMSLVGPRPERKVFVDQFSNMIPFYSRRLNVKPGITGWAQIRRGYDTSIEDVYEKLQYDLFYLENISVGLDIKILLNTLWVMIAAKGR